MPVDYFPIRTATPVPYREVRVRVRIGVGIPLTSYTTPMQYSKCVSKHWPERRRSIINNNRPTVGITMKERKGKE